MQNKKHLFVCSILTVSVLTGCGTQQTINKAEEALQGRHGTAENALVTARAQAKKAAVVRHKGPRLYGAEVITIEKSKSLPAAFQNTYQYQSATRTFDGVMSDIARGTGFSVRKIVRPVGATAQKVNEETNKDLLSPGFSWNGPLAGFLDQLARSNGLYWRFNAKAQEILFFREETRTFSIHVPTTDNTVSSSIALAGAGGAEGAGSGGSGSSGGNSSGNVSISGNSKINAFESVLMGVRAYVLEEQALNTNTQGNSATNQINTAANGTGRTAQTNVQGVVGNEGLGMVTVTATPPTLERIEAYIDNVNKRFARNIYINVKIYSLTVDNEAVSGASISAAISNLADTRGINFSPSGLTQPSSGTPGKFTMRLANAGSSVDVVAQALNTLGKASLFQSAQITAANGQPAPVQIAEDVNFLESSNTTVVPNVGVTNALIQGTRTVGLTGNVIPRYLDDNRLLLQYQLNLSSMTLTEARSGNTYVQIPKISRQALQQQAYLYDGESLVLFGYEQQRVVSDNTSGILSASNRGNTQRTMVVIVMDVFGDTKNKKDPTND